MCRAETKKIVAVIKKRSDNYYEHNKNMCRKHNFFKRCEVFIKYHKRIWPPLKRYELEVYIKETRLPGKFWKGKNLW